MISVTFYNNKSAHTVRNKVKTAIKTSICDVSKMISIETPELILENDDALLNANYCYIAKFGRFYDITDRSIDNYNMLHLVLKSDPISSFDYGASQVIANRSASHFDMMIEDNCVTHNPQPIYIYRKLPFEFTPSSTGYNYVLTLGG